MGGHMITPPVDASSPSDGSIRKRVCKACDRCRLKKSKCDGSNPCSRCKSDNAICVFGERKKSHDKVYPKGYVEMLENQQSQLVTGLQELYKRVQNGQGWIGSPLKETTHGAPLTHDILERLGALKQDNAHDSESFEEDLGAMQQRLISSGAGYMQRSNSTDSDSEAAQSPIFEQHLPSRRPELTTSFAATRFPPTPPSTSPYMRSASTSSSAGHLRFAHSVTPQSAMNPALLQQSTWSPPINNIGFEENMEFLNRFEAMPQLETLSPQMFQPNINACLPMRDWQDENEEFSRFFNPTMST